MAMIIVACALKELRDRVSLNALING